jgi:hypothetical protein
LSVVGGVAELEGFFSDEDAGRGDFTMSDTLLLEFSKDTNHMLGQKLKLNFGHKDTVVHVVNEFLFHSSLEGVEVNLDDVVFRAEGLGLVSGVTNDVDKVGMRVLDSVVVIDDLLIESFLIVTDDVFHVHFLASLDVSDKSAFTELAADLLLLDDFDFRVEG